MKRGIKDYGMLMLKGIAMGAADVVPGVSGGTVAFIVGIYEELINSIKSINPTNLKLLFSLRIAEFWKAINANFLLALVTACQRMVPVSWFKRKSTGRKMGG
jgi:putative membrane protein